MKKIKIVSVLLVLSIIGCFSGCGSNHDKGNLKDNLIDDTKEYTISSGDNYIVLKGDNFSGSLELTVKDVEN